MRVLFTTTPGRGHYHPMLQLADACRRRGHEVLWAAHADVCACLRSDGYEAVEAGLPESITSGGLAAQFPELMELPPAERPDFLFSELFGPARAGPMLDAVLPAAREWEPSLLVCDQAELAGPLVAALLGVPTVTHGFGHPLPEVRLVRAGERMAPLWEARGLASRPHAGTYDHLYLDIYPESLKAAGSPHIAEVQSIRPYTPGPGGAPDDDPPLVYVTFGTVFNQDLDLIRAVVEGVARHDVGVLVTLGPDADPGALGPHPPHVEVAAYVPQAEVLPRCTAVVSHAGSGTFLAALAHGLPQLLAPRAADQFLNAKAGAGAGVALALEGDPAADEVEEALGRLLADPSFRRAAKRMAGEIAAMPDADAVVAVLEARTAA